MRALASGTAAVAMLLAACARPSGYHPSVPGGQAQRGEGAVARYNCGSCHRIPGIRGAGGSVGPDLGRFGRRVYIAGNLPNAPEYLVPWIEDAPALKPGTAMPDLGVGAGDARDIAAYLYTLQ